jgi:ComF family protein
VSETALWALGAIADLVWPLRCAGCGEERVESPRRPFCPRCAESVERIGEPWCPSCGGPFAGRGGLSHLCPRCRRAPPPFAIARQAAVYGGPLAEALRAFKFGGRSALAGPLGALCAWAAVEGGIDPADYDKVVPVPAPPTRRRARGYNQAALLAREMGRLFGLPVDYAALRKPRPTPRQVGLSADERLANLRGSFAALPKRVRGLRLIVVDDIYTTGATARECARTLRRAGASRVAAAAVARTPGP